MKKWIAMSIVATMILSGCSKNFTSEQKETKPSYETVSENIKPSEDSVIRPVPANWNESFSEHFNEITIDGTAISFPIAYSEFENLGFHMKTSLKDIVSNGSIVEGSCSWGEEKTGIFGVDFGFHGTEDHKPLETCDVVSFSWYADMDEGPDVVFYGGINGDSTREEVAKVLDEAYVDENGAQYVTRLDDVGYAQMEVIFVRDEVAIISLKNYAGYIN